jgi:RNA polymerase sigma-70 factor (ECF subfamily)
MRKEIEQAVALLDKHDQRSVEQALELLQGTVFSFSMKVCGQREDAEDTMQEAVKALPYLPKFENPRALLVWLYKVAKNRCLMSRRKSKFAPKQGLSLEELMPDRQELAQLGKEGPVNPDTLAIGSQQAKRKRQVIQELPPEFRITLVLRDMEGLTDKEVGEQLDDSLCEKLEEHLAGCEPCKAFLESLEAVVTQLSKLPSETLNKVEAAKIRKDVLSRYRIY